MSIAAETLPQPDPSAGARILPLDGLRGIAAIMVVVWHLTGSMVDRSWGAWAEALHASTVFGRTGVDLFFVLSGFLIIGIITDRRDAPNFYRVFYTRRSLRIMPPYLALVLLYWLCFAVLGTSPSFNADYGFGTQLLHQLTFTYNWLMAAHDHAISRGFSVTWSVAIEEWFYLFFPAALLMTPRRHVWKLLLTVGLASAAARAGWHLANPTVGLTPYVMPQFRLDGLCAGGLVALAVRAPQALALVTARWSALRTLALALVIPVPLVIAFIRPALASNMYIWGHLWLSIAFALLILVVVTAPQRFGVLASRPLRLAGRYSYSLYLFHPLFLSLFFVLAGRPELLETPGDVALMLGSLATTIIVCVLLYAFVEKAALRRGHEARYAPPPRTAGELVVPAVR